jgi:glycosyltransferase involved in cell wall biosynthesis
MPAHSELASALAKLGHIVMVICFSDLFDQFAGDGYYELLGVSVHQLRPSYERYQAWSCGMQLPEFTRISAEAHQMHSKLKHVVEEFQPDVIDCQEFNGLAFFFAQEHRYPLTLHCYGPLAHLMRSGDLGNVNQLDTELVDIFELAVIAEADGLIACSEDVARKHSYRSGRPMSDFVVIKVPLSAARDIPSPTLQSEERFPRLLYFGRVDPLKGASLLMESIPLIAEKFPNFQLIVAGGEPPQPGHTKKYAEIMREKLTDLGLMDHVRFLGRVSRSVIKQNVVDADVCIFPSKYETAGYACLEAVSYGGAVVATAVGGLPEYHVHEKSVYLVPPNSGSELANGIAAVVEDNKMRLRLKTDGAKHVLETCDPEKIALKTIAIYEKAIERYTNRTSPNYSFSMLSRLINVLIEQSAPIAPAYRPPVPNAPSTKNKTPMPPVGDGIVTSTSVVRSLGEMVLGQLGKIWKEGYDQGYKDGLSYQRIQSVDRRGIRSLLSAAVQRIKNFPEKWN